MADEYETEGRWTRGEIAAYLGRFAAALDGDGEVHLALGDDAVTVAPPAECDFEVEVEREEGRREVELEIEWDVDAEGATGDAGAESESHTDADEPDVVAAEATGEVPAVGAESQAEFELFEDRSGEWRWRLVHDNGNVIASSGEGYTRKANARKGLRSVKRNAPGAPETEE